MSKGSTSFARVSEKPSTPHLAAAYGASNGPDTTCDGSDLDDMARASLPKVGQHGLGQNNHPKEIRFNLCAKFLQRGVLDRSNSSVTGVVDQNIKFSESPNCGPHCLT